MNHQANPERDPVPATPGASRDRASEHLAEIPGGSLYYRVQGSGPPLVLIGGGPANADTLGPLASYLADDHAVVSYDRRGYSRSRLDDPGEQVGISRHSDDLRRLIAALGAAPVSVFGTSFGSLIALDLAVSAPDSIETLIVHEPPLGQLLTNEERQHFDLDLDDEGDAGSALDAIAASIGVKRGLSAGGTPTRPELRSADVELFIRRDVPAIGAYRLDIDQLSAVSGRVIVTASEDGRGFYPYQCALRLADHLGTPLVELPGNHAGMIQHPAQFAVRLQSLLRQPPATRLPATGEQR